MRALRRVAGAMAAIMVGSTSALHSAVAEPAHPPSLIAPDQTPGVRQTAGARTTDDAVIGSAGQVTTGAPARAEAETVAIDTAGGGGAPTGPVCWYEPLRYTTQQAQRSDIRPEEQRPGQWGWRVCDDGTERFQFFPDGPDGPAPAPDPVDPAALADSVVLTPDIPTVHTSPPAGTLQLVNLPTWFWIDPADWEPASEGASAGPVQVTVTATPGTLVVDPGDGSPPLRCPGGGTPYDTGRPVDNQRSACTHTYTESGTFTASATVVYDVRWTSNIAPGSALEDITPPGEPFEVQVAEGQAVVIAGGGAERGSGGRRAASRP